MKIKKSKKYFPLLLNLEKYPCLVIGGGDVALRKVESLLQFSGRVTVVAPEMNGKLKEYGKLGIIKLIEEPYSRKQLKDFRIVFSTTDDPEINKQIRNDCTGMDIFLNAADIPELCDFILPANINRGALTVSISSQGAAPFYVKHTKKELDDFLKPELGKIIDLAGEFRSRLMQKDTLSWQEKQTAFNKFVEIDWDKKIAADGYDAAYNLIKQIINEI